MPVMGTGPTFPEGVLVGEGPGREEAEEGQPFVGSTGRELDAALAKAGLLRSRMYLLNATCCQPPPSKSEPMMERAVACCAPAFRAQLYKVPATVPVFAMGRWAAAAVTGQSKGVMESRGFIRELGERKLIISWHPTYAAFRNPYEWGAFELDLDRFARLLNGQLQPAPRRIVTRPTVKDVRAVAEDGWVAFDIETSPAKGDESGVTGRHPTRARLRSVGLGNQVWGLAHYWGTDPLVEGAIIELLANADVMKVGHNIIWFDIPVLRRHGIQVRNYVDTRDMRRAMSATSQLSLRYLASILTDSPPWKEADSDGAK